MYLHCELKEMNKQPISLCVARGLFIFMISLFLPALSSRLSTLDSRIAKLNIYIFLSTIRCFIYFMLFVTIVTIVLLGCSLVYIIVSHFIFPLCVWKKTRELLLLLLRVQYLNRIIITCLTTYWRILPTESTEHCAHHSRMDHIQNSY